MIPKNTTLLTLLFLCLAGSGLFAQAEDIRLPAPDLTALRAADAGREHQRFSAPLKLNVAPGAEAADYVYADGALTWTRTFHVPRTSGLALFVDSLRLPADGTLTLHNAHGRRGPFTQDDASALRRIFTGFLPGESVSLTYRGSLPDTVPFRVWRVDHVYRPDLWGGGLEKGFGDSNACQVNANCPPGDGWEDEKSGAARLNLVVAEGVGYCSGSLINNTAEDGRPLLLTGFHCMDGFTPLYDLWTVDFGYAAATCTTPATEPAPEHSYLGVQPLAGRRDNDFLLLEITDAAFAAEDHYFAGWDRSDGDVSGIVRHFHHPQGDIQKVATSDASGMPVFTASIRWTNDLTTPPAHHFEVDLTTGSYEIGSSGSAFFDADHRIRGHLSGGRASCDGENIGYVGRLHLAWAAGDSDTERLAPWLDPLGTAPMTLDGKNILPKRFVTGRVFTTGGLPAVGAKITFAWSGGQREYTVDDQGNYRGERPADATEFNISGTYGEDLPRETGVDVGDLITIRRHLLELDTLPPLRLLAADVNNTGSVSVSDITRITRVLLGRSDWNGRPNWLVLPIGLPINPIPVSPQEPVGIVVNDPGIFELPVDFLVLKTGDADGSLD